MPASSTSMVFTWAVESVLLGLVGMSVVDDFMVLAQLATASLALVLHVAGAAANVDSYHSVSISYLCSLVGLLVAACLRPLDQTPNVILVCLMGVATLAATGMVFASSTGSTALVLAMRGHFAPLVAVLLDQVRCNTAKVYLFSPGELNIALALALISSQLVPYHTAALSVGAVLNAGLAAFLYLTKRRAASYLAMAVAALDVLWAVGVWLPVWIPDLSLPSLSLPTVTMFGLPVFKINGITIEAGPWIVTMLLVLFFLGFSGIVVWQGISGNTLFVGVVAVPLVFVIVWLVVVWAYRPAAAPAPQEATPSAPPLHAARRIAWPRFKAHAL